MKPIVIQGAEISETDYLESVLENKEKIQIGEFIFYKGKFGNQDIIISRTMVGEINSSAATAIAIMKFEPEFIINQGTAGGQDVNIHKGEFVVGERFVQLNSYYSNYLEKGKGYSIDNWIIKDYGEKEEIPNYKLASPKLLKMAKEILPNISDNCVYFGVIGSGDIWNREIDRILYLNKTFNTLCEEMEIAGVYKTANKLNVPVLGIRIISNNELLGEEYEPEIATKCQKVIYEFVKKIGEMK